MSKQAESSTTQQSNTTFKEDYERICRRHDFHRKEALRTARLKKQFKEMFKEFLETEEA